MRGRGEKKEEKCLLDTNHILAILAILGVSGLYVSTDILAKPLFFCTEVLYCMGRLAIGL